jgi:hypothetical protein
MEATMIMDASLFQGWIRAHDHYEQARRRHDAALATGNSDLIDYLRSDMDHAAQELNQAIKELKNA